MLVPRAQVIRARRRRYQLNAAIAASPKPQVSIWDGFCLGGGAGVSVHGAFRVATEKTVFAMPETNIGVKLAHFLRPLPKFTPPMPTVFSARLLHLLFTPAASQRGPT